MTQNAQASSSRASASILPTEIWTAVGSKVNYCIQIQLIQQLISSLDFQSEHPQRAVRHMPSFLLHLQPFVV